MAAPGRGVAPFAASGLPSSYCRVSFDGGQGRLGLADGVGDAYRLHEIGDLAPGFVLNKDAVGAALLFGAVFDFAGVIDFGEAGGRRARF